MSFWVYIIFSEKFDRFYIGQTNDMDGRIKRHNAGYVESTKSFRPWALKLALSKENRFNFHRITSLRSVDLNWDA
jgi:putative endonuclease